MTRLQPEYTSVLTALKAKIRQARVKASLAVNYELLWLYWEIGHAILERKENEGWGTKVIARLASDLKSEFPDMKGLSVRNLVYMQTFAASYPDFTITQVPLAQLENMNEGKISITQASLTQLETTTQNAFVQSMLAQLTWYHHITLLDKVKDTETRLFYIRETVQNGWSRDVMVHQIEGGLHLRKGKALTNFDRTIAPQQSELVTQVFKVHILIIEIRHYSCFLFYKKVQNQAFSHLFSAPKKPCN